MKTVKFNSNGQKLWVAIEPGGLYAVSFTCRLLESDNINTPPFILTEPANAGDNGDGQPKYYFPVVNSFKPGEPLAAYDGRYASATFFIKTLADDNGYTITMELLQGDDHTTAASLGSDTISGTVGDDGYKEAEIKLQLVKN